MAARPPLTDAERTQIAQLFAQGLPLPRIAEQLGFPYLQVWRAAKGLGLQLLPGRPYRKRLPAVELPAGQQALLKRFTLSGWRVGYVAQRLGVDWRRLSRQLRGREKMSPTHLAALDRILPK